jgi:hypothetical protein
VGRTVRKPGRGSSTECVSCADKLSKWLALGLLSKRSTSRVPLAGLVVGGGFESRAILQELLRVRQCPEASLEVTQLAFPHDEREGAHPSGLALNWMEGDVEAEVTQPNGKKMGATTVKLGEAVNPKHVSRLAPVHRVVGDADYDERKAAWKAKVGF